MAGYVVKSTWVNKPCIFAICSIFCHGVNHVLHHKKALISVITMPTRWCIVALLQLSISDVILLFIASPLVMSKLPTIIALCVAIYLLVPLPWPMSSLAPPVSRVIASSSIGLVFMLLLLVMISWMATKTTPSSTSTFILIWVECRLLRTSCC